MFCTVLQDFNSKVQNKKKIKCIAVYLNAGLFDLNQANNNHDFYLRNMI